jgi:glycosyltransferase involved in cell wall biosynthesis
VAKTKILLCHNYYREPGGESVVFKNEVMGLTAAGYKVITYTRDNREIEVMNQLERFTLIPSGFKSRRTMQEVTRLICEERPNVAIIQNVFPLISPSIYELLHNFKVRIIQAVYNYRFLCANGELYTNGEICERCLKGNHLYGIIYRCYRNSALLSAWYGAILGYHRKKDTFSEKIDIFMVPDDFLANKLSEGGIPFEKIRKNVNPFFVNEYDSVYKHEGFLLFIGRLSEQKGILTLLNSMVIVKSPAQLVIVGQGELEDYIIQIIRERKLEAKIKFMGPLWGGKVKKLIARAMAIVVPSEWYDNLPQIVCQSFATAKPVIAAAINGIPEYVSDGDDGFLYDPENPRDLAKAIDMLYEMNPSNYSKMCTEARKKAEEVFDYRNHLNKLDSIFHELDL